MQYKVIAIDGPAGAGKSTIAKKIAAILGYTYIDTGAMYRALTLKILQNQIDICDKKSIIQLVGEVDIDFINHDIYLDGINVNTEIRQECINKNVSYPAEIGEVRRVMVALQRKIAQNKNVVMDGRDVGTVIFPDAFSKFFLTATVEERARRRCAEIQQSGGIADFEDIKSQIEKRDYIDSHREESPLKAAEDAILVDTTGKSIEEVVSEIIRHIPQK